MPPKTPKITSFIVGDRVQTHPATDDWMRGDRYGEIVAVGRTRIKVAMERSGRTRSYLPQDLIVIG